MRKNQNVNIALGLLIAKDSFHETAHLLLQNPQVTNPGGKRNEVSLLTDDSCQTKHVQNLPVAYTNLASAQPLPKDVCVPRYHEPVRPPPQKVEDDRKNEYMWLEHQLHLCQKETLDETDYPSGAASLR